MEKVSNSPKSSKDYEKMTTKMNTVVEDYELLRQEYDRIVEYLDYLTKNTNTTIKTVSL